MKSTGYSEDEIKAGVKFVYGDRNIPLPKQASTTNPQSKSQGVGADKKTMAIIGIIVLAGFMVVLGYLAVSSSDNKEECRGADCGLQGGQLDDENDSLGEKTYTLQRRGEVSTQKVISINGVDFIASQSE